MLARLASALLIETDAIGNDVGRRALVDLLIHACVVVVVEDLQLGEVGADCTGTFRAENHAGDEIDARFFLVAAAREAERGEVRLLLRPRERAGCVVPVEVEIEVVGRVGSNR